MSDDMRCDEVIRSEDDLISSMFFSCDPDIRPVTVRLTTPGSRNAARSHDLISNMTQCDRTLIIIKPQPAEIRSALTRQASSVRSGRFENRTENRDDPYGIIRHKRDPSCLLPSLLLAMEWAGLVSASSPSRRRPWRAWRKTVKHTSHDQRRTSIRTAIKINISRSRLPHEDDDDDAFHSSSLEALFFPKDLHAFCLPSPSLPFHFMCFLHPRKPDSVVATV
ncbi:hypothetical protein V8F20_000752 [Naviculisporaceae sp. PSN 640]